MMHTTDTHSVVTAAERATPSTESGISLIHNGPLRVQDVLRAGMRRRARRKGMARQSIWDSDGGVGKPWTADVPLGGTTR